MATATLSRLTPEDLLAMPDGDRFELVDGELVERNMSIESSAIGFEINRYIGNHIAEHHLGIGFQSDAGLQIFPWAPDQVRFPDGGFLAANRIPAGVPGPGHLRVAPDLLIEDVSPGDNYEAAEIKINDYLRAGVKLVWTLLPAARTIRVDRANGTSDRLGPDATLSGEDVLPGFSVKVGDILPG